MALIVSSSCSHPITRAPLMLNSKHFCSLLFVCLLPVTSCIHLSGSSVGPGAAGPPGVNAGSLRSEIVREGSLERRLVQDDASMVVFYGGELRGSMDTCGCPKEPRGSLARVKAYIEAERRLNPSTPELRIAGGHFLDDAIALGGGLRDDAKVANLHMVRGLRASGFTAINVGAPDLLGMARGGATMGEIPLLGTNTRRTSAAKEDVISPAPFLLVERGAMRIGILGISGQGGTEPFCQDYELIPAEPAVEKALEELGDRVDIIILIAWQTPSEARRIVEKHPEIDLVVDTYLHRETSTLFTVGETLWVKAAFEFQRLGELRLWVNNGRVETALDRQIDMDPEIPGDASLLELSREAREAIQRSMIEIFGH